MEIGIIVTQDKQIIIADVGDDNAPLVKLCNECNNIVVAKAVYDAVVGCFGKEKDGT